MSHFDSEAQRWDQRPTSQQLVVVPPRLLERVAFAQDDQVLDFGAGTGLLATAIAPHVAQVAALDLSEAMLQVLQGKGHANIQTVLADVLAYAPAHAGQYQAIVSCMALHHVPDTAALLQAFAQLLDAGGQLALVDLYAEDGSFHGSAEENAAKGVHHHGFAPAALQALAEQAGFSHIRFSEIAQIQRPSGRSYPLFLLQARKA